MTETEIIKEKKRNIYSSFFSEDYVSKFLFKSILHHVISLEIYENNGLSGISFETICANIPKSIGSRSSIQSILNEALEKNIFVKEQSKSDKRIKNYCHPCVTNVCIVINCRSTSINADVVLIYWFKLFLFVR